MEFIKHITMYVYTLVVCQKTLFYFINKGGMDSPLWPKVLDSL